MKKTKEKIKAFVDWLLILFGLRLVLIMAVSTFGFGGAVGTGLWLNGAPKVPLSSYQATCAQAIARLIIAVPEIEPKGRYQVTAGEWHRPEITALVYAKQGSGIKQSLHTKRLAIDLNLIVDGVYQADSAAHAPLAAEWVKIGTAMGIPVAWGGDFSSPDGNHYSCSWGGLQ